MRYMIRFHDSRNTRYVEADSFFVNGGVYVFYRNDSSPASFAPYAQINIAAFPIQDVMDVEVVGQEDDVPVPAEVATRPVDVRHPWQYDDDFPAPLPPPNYPPPPSFTFGGGRISGRAAPGTFAQAYNVQHQEVDF